MSSNSNTFDTEEGISIYFVVFSSLLALVLITSKLLNNRPKLARFLPEAGMVMLVGIASGSIASLFISDKPADNEGDDDAIDQVAQSLLSFDANVFFVALLPPIIFNSGYHLRSQLFFRHITPILLFACVGTLVSALTIAFMLEIVGAAGLTGDFRPTFTELLTFGALISATDPVSTLAVFQAKRVDPQLFYLVFGESVMNDAVGLVLFNSFAKFVQRDNGFGKVTLGILEFMLDFIVDSVGSLCLGFLSGMAAALLLKKVDMRQTPLLELSVYILIMYVPFLLAEIVHVSGIVTILFTGIAARRYAVPNLSPETESNADVLFRLAAHLAETSIFLELGMSVCGLTGFERTWRFVLWSIFACLIGRAANVFPITFFFNMSLRKYHLGFAGRWGYGYGDEGNVEMLENLDVSPKNIDDSAAKTVSSISDITLTQPQLTDLKIRANTAQMLWFSGLRGAVAYACARTFPDTFGHRTEFIITTMMIVLVTVFVLGGTTEVALNVLHIEMNVNEDHYMEANYKEQSSDGFFFAFEKRFIYPCVVRDFALQGGTDEEGQPPISSQQSVESATSYRPQIERTESDHIELVQSMGYPARRKESLYDFGLN